MGVFAGPDVSESGLVLALDGANLKSFKGEATTNEIVSVTWNGDGTNQTAFTAGSTLVTDQNLTYKGYETYLWAPATSLNCYLNGADLSTLRTSTVWTFSCYVKREDGAAITSLSVYMYYPTSDGAAAGTIEDVGNGWYRVSRTRTGTDNYLDLVGFTGFAANVKYYLSGAQVEKKSYPTTFVATNTTRGTTVATGGGWADLTGRGNNGELVNGVRESSDNLGSLVFDGIDDYIPLTSTITAKTILSFVRVTASGGDYVVYGLDANGADNWFGINGNFVHLFGTEISDVNNFSLLGTTSIQTNVWYHISCTIDGTTAKVYLNGKEENSTTKAFTIGSWNTTPTIGRRGSLAQRYFPGNIANLQVYNRVLTASEIQQNYIATKSRFGL